MTRGAKTTHALTVIAALALGAMAIGCGGPPGHGAPPSGRPDCGVANTGPLLPITHTESLAPPTHGGVIHDGVYDMTHVVVFHSGKPTTRPALRISMALRTEERSSNHIAGSIWESIEETPDVACRVRRFSLSGGSFRMTGQGKDETIHYTATPDSLTLISQRGETADVGMFYRRRR